MTSSLREKLQEKAYRDAFVASQIRIALAFQIRALREQRGWTQAQLAKHVGMLQPRISAMERPGGSKFSLETLLRLASAFDIAFVGRFMPFSELVEWAESFSPDTFRVSPFEDEINAQKKSFEVDSGEIPPTLKEKALRTDKPQSEKLPESLQQILIARNKSSNVIQFPGRSSRISEAIYREGEMPHAAIGGLSR